MHPIVRHLNSSRGDKRRKSLECKVETDNNSYNLLDICVPGTFHLAVLFQKSNFLLPKGNSFFPFPHSLPWPIQKGSSLTPCTLSEVLGKTLKYQEGC